MHWFVKLARLIDVRKQPNSSVWKRVIAVFSDNALFIIFSFFYISLLFSECFFLFFSSKFEFFYYGGPAREDSPDAPDDVTDDVAVEALRFGRGACQRAPTLRTRFN